MVRSHPGARSRDQFGRPGARAFSVLSEFVTHRFEELNNYSGGLTIQIKAISGGFAERLRASAMPSRAASTGGKISCSMSFGSNLNVVDRCHPVIIPQQTRHVRIIPYPDAPIIREFIHQNDPALVLF